MRIWTRMDLTLFVAESNRIEGINVVLDQDLAAHGNLLELEALRIADVEAFVDLVAGAQLRRSDGMNVRVGGYLPPPGGRRIPKMLTVLLEQINTGELSPFDAHVAYETLHPFNDGNGRSGRAIWAWQMLRDGRNPFHLGFLHTFYYQTLQASRR